MPRKRKQIGEPADEKAIEAIPEAEKQHFYSLGYKPYITSSGKVKWLNDEQYVYKVIKYESPKRLIKMHQRKYMGHRKPMSHAKIWMRMIVDNWRIITLVVIVLLLVYYINDIVQLLRNYI